MSFGLAWIRRRQRALARGVLALFCLAWLQVAAVPCVMADDIQPGAGPQNTVDAAQHDCRYCPPAAGDHGTGGVHHGACTYPHGPQVNGPSAAGLALLLPAVIQQFGEDRAPAASGVMLVPPSIVIVPDTPLTVSYCRRIE